MIGLIAFQSCTKEDEGSKYFLSASSPFDVTGITINNDMIYFSDTSDLIYLDKQIDAFNNDYNTDPNIICSSDTGNIAFETQMGFNSLRKKIDTYETTLENNDNLWDYNDPDDHFVYDDFERTILNEKLEYGIINTVYKYINEYTILEIEDDIATLNNIRQNQSNIKPYLCSPNLTINSYADIGTLDAAYEFTQNNLTVSFTNKSNNANDYYWDFGDGTSSTLENPTHTYAQSGYYDVVLIVSTHFNGVEVYDRKTCRVPPPGNCTANFNYDRNSANNLELHFLINSSAQQFKQVTWNWGDGSPSENYYNTSYLQNHYEFPSAGKYKVTLTIKDMTDCVATYKYTVVAGSNDCRFYKSTPTKYEKYDYDTRKFKYKFFIRNGIAHHRIKARIKNYKIKSNGSKKRERADNLTVNYIGTVYFYNTCGSNPTQVNFPVSLTNKKKAVCKTVIHWGSNPSDAVRILDSELTAYFSATKNNNTGTISIQINQ